MSLKEISAAVTLHRAAAVLLSEMVRSASNRRSAERGVPVGTKTITMYVSDLDQSEIPAGQAYQLSIRHPDGSTQQLDISEQNYHDLKLAGVGKTLKKAWPQARVHHRGGQRLTQAPPAPAQRTARHRLTQATPERSPWSLDSQADAKLSGWCRQSRTNVEDLTRRGRSCIAGSSCLIVSTPTRRWSPPFDVVRRWVGNTATRVSSSNRC